MAATYDQWAREHEATAKKIQACLDSVTDEVREHQRWRADQLMAEAAALKVRAQELRKLAL